MKGLTLFEVLISILIFAIIATGLGYAVAAGKSALFISDIPTKLRQDLIFGLIPMARELRQAGRTQINIAEGASANSVTFRLPRDNDADGVVVTSYGVVEWDPNTITYALDGANQLIRTYAGASRVITSNISALQFSRPVGSEVLLQINIWAQKTDAQGTLYQDTEQLTIKMRN